MANITPRKNKDGVITFYTIRVYHGYDGANKRLKPYTTSYKPAPNMTARQIEKKLNRQAVQFIEARTRSGVCESAFRCTLCSKPTVSRMRMGAPLLPLL